MIPAVVLSALLVICVCQPSNAQTSGRQSASPAVANHSEPSSVGANSSVRQPVSAEARAEARRLYKEGVKYGQSGLPKQAAEIFERAVKLDPDYVDAYFSLSHAYFDMGNWNRAKESLNTLLKLNPTDSEGRALLAQVEAAAERRGDATSTDGGTSRSETQVAQRTEVGGNGPAVSSASNPSEKIDKENLTRIYKVGAGDVLDVRLTDATSNKSTLFTITPSGLLEHPDLPDPMPVAGLTIEEITAALAADLKRRAVTDNLKVWVGVREYGSHAILVSGLVKEPGTKIIRREAIPLYVVIADAQPLPEAARLTLARNQSNEFISIELTDTKQMNLLVLPGDVITLHPHEVQFFYVSGEVKAPGEKTFRRGLTLTQALMIAGGVSPKSKEARLARDDGNGFLVVTRYKLKDIDSGKVRDPLLQPGDRITIVE
ncbi:MAG TPA: tetratricopeptide repeat protein [Pyrinomonadaceae bacterium]